MQTKKKKRNSGRTVEVRDRTPVPVPATKIMPAGLRSTTHSTIPIVETAHLASIIDCTVWVLLRTLKVCRMFYLVR